MKKIKKEREGEFVCRSSTGIAGFDSLCEGGFVSDSLNLIVGNAGSGKTLFLLRYLYNGAKNFDEAGIYISFEPEIKDLLKMSNLQGMDLEPFVEKGKIDIVKIDPEITIKKFQSEISRIIIEKNIKRVCIDPINVYSLFLDDSLNFRKYLYELLSWFKKLGVCVLVAGESDEDSGGRYGLSEEIKFCKYLVDGVVELFSSGIGGEGDRAVRISKMRMTKHYRGPVPFAITDKGIKITGKY